MARNGTGARTDATRRRATSATRGKQPRTSRSEAARMPDTAQAPITPRLSDASAQAAAELFRALADPTRLQILDVLRGGGGEISVRELEGAVGLPDPQTGRRPRQPTISHHLKVLRMAGLVGFRRRGPWIHYYVRDERLSAARALLDTLV